MSKKIIGLLLVLCLVVGLLPVVALAENPTTVKFALCKWETVTVTEGGAAVYYKNVPIDLYLDDQGTPAGIQGYTSPVASDDTDWNIKFEYPAGGIPTVTLKDAKVIRAINGKPVYTLSGGVYKKFGGEYSVFGPCDTKFDVKFVLEGDNVIDFTYGVFRGDPGGIEAFNNITIEGKPGSKLTANGGMAGISPEKGGNLTFINAVVDISNTRANAAPIYTTGGNITINGGHITVSNTMNAALEIKQNGTAGGNLTITDAKLTAVSELSEPSEGTGAVNVNGNVIVNGNSELNLEGKNNPGILAHNGDITVNSGEVNVTGGVGVYAVAADSVNVNGGTVEVTGFKAFKVAPVLAAGINGICEDADAVEYAYADTENAHEYPYVKLGAGVQAPTTGTEAPTTGTEAPTTGTEAPTTGTEAPTTGTEAPTTGTEAPTTGTEAPTTGTEAPTQAPTQAATQAPTQGAQNPATGDNSIMMFSALLLVAVFGIVATVAFGKKNSVAE